MMVTWPKLVCVLMQIRTQYFVESQGCVVVMLLALGWRHLAPGAMSVPTAAEEFLRPLTVGGTLLSPLGQSA